MKLVLSILSSAIAGALLVSDAYAQDLMATGQKMEIIHVTGAHSVSIMSANPQQLPPQIDISQTLNSLAGASVNSNGPLTGIAQYRGLSGDRVNTCIDGATLSGAGPNAMDTPISYASLVMTERVELYRGTAPVPLGIDTLGGSINVIQSQAIFSQNSGTLMGQFLQNGQRSNLGAKANVANDDHAILVFVDDMNGNNNVKSADDRRISPTTYDKQFYGAQYRFNLGQHTNESLGLAYQHTETTNAGTPALPMDIDFIRTDRVKLDGIHELAQWQINWHLAYSDARHGMDNFSERHLMPTMAARYNNANSKSIDSKMSVSNETWEWGVNVQMSQHDSVITNPQQAIFLVDNFADVTDDKYSAYAQWQQNFGLWNWSAGTRVKLYRSDADDVRHSMAASMPAINMLMQRFNQADKSQSKTGLDLVLNGRYQVQPSLNWIVGLARKQAPASYQQHYLWVPMQSTGGLADGRTYVGQIDLALETAYQVEFGADYQAGDVSISPRVFYHRINDYIQGVAATDPTVLMAASMMGDNSPMQFANVDAQLFGLDVNATYLLNHALSFDMLASYIRGERRDLNDNLYRISPPKVTLGINYQQQAWQARLEITAVGAQNKVSDSQFEQVTPGYAVINASAGYDVDAWAINAGLNNLFDTEYSDHLGGYNRVMGSSIELNERMPAMGIGAWITGEYRF